MKSNSKHIVDLVQRAPGNRLRALVLHLLLVCATPVATRFDASAEPQQTTNSAPESSASPEVDHQEAESGTDRAQPTLTRGGDELGGQEILRRNTRPRMFQAYSDTQYVYDSNVLLADGEFIQVGHDSVFIEDLGASFSAPIVETLSSILYYRHDLVRYNDFSQFDFDADSGGLHLGRPIADLFTLYGDVSVARYYFREHGHEFYKYYNLELGLGREQRLTRRLSLGYGYQLDLRPSTPSQLTRLDNAIYLAANLAVLDKLSAQFFYRIRAREYYEAGHADLDNILNLTLAYSINDHVSLRASGTYGVNKSSESLRNYDVFNAGGGLSLSIRF